MMSSHALKIVLLLMWMMSFLALADTSMEYHAEASMSTTNNSSVFFVPDEYQPVGNNRLLHELLFNTIEDDVRLLAAAYVWHDGIHQNLDANLQLQELVYDFSFANYDASMEKKVVSWGVGYGFRPLDIIQQESRLAWQSLSTEGVYMFAMHDYDDGGSDSLVLHRLSEEQIDGRYRYRSALAWQHYLLLNNTDIYSVAQLDEASNYKMGAGFSQVVGDHLEWHASFLYLSRYEKFTRDTAAPLIATTDPFRPEIHQHGLEALLGVSWTWRSGLGMMLEAWYDDRAYSQKAWQDLFELGNQQRALLGGPTPESAIYNNLNWNSRAFNTASLMQKNVLLRVNYEGEEFDPSFYYLWSPEDGGYIANLDIIRELGENSHLYLSWRKFGGNEDAVYAQLPSRELLGLGFSISGLW